MPPAEVLPADLLPQRYADWGESSQSSLPAQAVAGLDWRVFFSDATLHGLIEQALQHHADLR
ncbi:MAG: multidrug transporter, partial [Ideonella sp.]